MLKKSVLAVLAASALFLGGASAANAQPDLGDYPDDVSVTVFPTVIRPLETSTITFSEDYFEPGEIVAIDVAGESGAEAGLAAIAPAARSTLTTSKAASSDGSLVAVFTAPADGDGTYDVSFSGSRDYTAVITVVPFGVALPSDVSVGDSSLANTGGGVSPVAIWAGLGALGLGVVALVASILRRRRA
ncbi:hypothetical protein RYJ27_08925 [Microbacterium limosum]|uniref:Gram-positive cocci surface proteins LPxTG domain-containing protein n=1 Tax=Microbacterium limosum TaxID=3079935 RepID=A0AAU0MFN7_9MICO|nr:hypothetical protein [Microbacterium sp. Y20]WOQ68832.1 hypothetical protein RYJ27_08925 [Microbacterium sp. Y20]